MALNMPSTPFFWDASGAKMSPDEVKRKRRIADAMIEKGADYSPIVSPWQGVARIANAISGKYQSDVADMAETNGRKQTSEDIAAMFGDGKQPDLGTVMQKQAENPWGGEMYAPIANALLERQMEDPAIRQARQLQLQKAQLELEQMRNPVRKRDWGVIGQDAYGNNQYGWIDERGGTIEPYQMPQAAQPATGAQVASPMEIPPAPPGTDPKVWRQKYTEMAAAEAERARSAERQKKASDVTNNVVVQDIDRILAIGDEAANDPLSPDVDNWVAGLIPGSAVNRISGLLPSIEANTSFETLQQMRTNSPTGGALGAVSEGEMKLLQSTKGALRTALEAKNYDDFKFNMRRLKNITLDIIHGPGNGPTREDLSKPSGLTQGGGAEALTADQILEELRRRGVAQ
jgi:hypothetical protein